MFSIIHKIIPNTNKVCQKHYSVETLKVDSLKLFVFF